MSGGFRTLLGTSIAHFVNDGTQFVFFMLYPILVLNYSLTILEVSVLAALLNTSAILASPFIGRKSDIGRNYTALLTVGIVLVGVGLGGYAVPMLFFSGLTLFLVLLPITLIGGVGLSIYHPVGATMVIKNLEPEVRGRALGINGAVGSMGRAIYPVVAVGMVGYFGYSSIWIMAAMALVASLVIRATLHGVSTFPTETKVREDSHSASKKVSMGAIMSSVLILTFSSFFRGIFSQGIISLIPTYLTTVGGLGYGSELAVAVLVMNSMGIVSQPLFGHIADKTGRRMTMVVTTVGAVVSMLLFLAAPGTELEVLYIAFLGLFTFNYFPLVMSLASELTPAGGETAANSMVWGVGNVGGGALGPLLIGLLAEPAALGSLGAALYAMTLSGVVSAVLLAFVRSPKAERRSSA